LKLQLHIFIKLCSYIIVAIFFVACNKSNELNLKKNAIAKIDSLFIAADIHFKKNSFEKSHLCIIQALQIAKEFNSTVHLINGNKLLLDYFNSQNIKDSASFYGEKALSYYDGVTSDKEIIKGTILAMTAISNLYIETDNSSISFKYVYECKKLASEINDKKFNVLLSGQLAYIYYGFGQYEFAQKYYKQKLNLIRNDEPNEQKIWEIQGLHRDIGLTNFNLNEYEKAILYYDSAIAVLPIKENHQNEKKYEIAYGIILGNKGQALAALNKYEDAIDKLKSNIKINIKPGYDNIDATSSLIALANIYLQSDDFKNFERTMQTTDSLYEVRSTNVYFTRLIKLKALAYEKLSKNKKAYELVKTFISNNDSTNLSVVKNNLRYKLGMIDVDKSKKQIDDLNSQTETNRNLYYRTLIAGIILAALLITIVLILMSSNKKSKKLRKLYQQNERNQIALENSNLEMQKIVVEKNNIIGIVAHDLKSPLSNITGITQLLEIDLNDKNVIDQDQLKLISYLKASALHMNNVTNDLLEMSMLDSSHAPLLLADTDINELIQKTILVFDIKAKEKFITIKFTSESNLTHNLNPQKIERVIGNLMGNAIKFSHAGSEINIAAKKTNSNLIIIVKDKGIGIPPENINAIFERFTKVKNFGTKGEKPVGLGLSIVKQIVEKHNGSISVKSEAGAGTEFFISIP